MKKFLSLMLSIIIIISCMSVVSAREFSEKKSYIVELSTPAVYSPDRVTFYSADDDMYREALLELQAEIRAQIDGGVSLFSARKPERTYTFTDVINGFTISVDAATAERIKNIDGVKSVCENEVIDFVTPAGGESVVTSAEETAGSGGNLSAANSGNMINSEAAYDKGYKGQGRAIAVIDGTINPNHIYYKLSEESTAKYTRADIAEILKNEMNVSATASNAYRNAKIPFAYNYAQDSAVVTGPNLHGVHVSGIAAGNSVKVPDGIIQGVAPEAQILFFGMYHPDGTPTASIVAALEDAVKFDVDAINISMGSDCASENMCSQSLASAVAACRNAGKTVVVATGNQDRMSDYTTMSDYGTSDNRIYAGSSKVASVQTETTYMTYFEDDGGNKYPCVAKGKTSAFDVTDVADCGSGTQAEINSAGVSGKIALITLPDAFVASGISTYSSRAMNAGAKGVVIINNSEDLTDGNSGYGYSLFLVSKASQEQIKNAKKLKFTGERAVVQRAETPRENKYSSYSYADNLDISVDFSAPGGNIYSSYGGTSGFTNLSGTSMAAPHVTGAVSLMCQYVEENLPTFTGINRTVIIKNLLASTAKSIYTQNGAIASPRKVGAGLVQLDKAMESKIILRATNSAETKINLGADLGKSFDISFAAYNLGNTPVTFSGVDVEISADDYKTYEGKGNGYYGRKKLTATVQGSTTVTVPARGRTNVALSVTLDETELAYLGQAMVNGFFIDGKVTITGSTNCDVGIPFSGFYGDWARLSIMNEKRVLDKFSVFGISDDGFNPPAMITKGESGLVMPMSENIDATVSDIRVGFSANPLRNAYATVKFDGVTVLDNVFINKEVDLAYYFGTKTLDELSKASVVTVELRLPYYKTNARNQKFNINIVKDNTPPEILDMYTEGDKQVYLDISDNYGVSAVSSYGMRNGTMQINDAYMGVKNGTAELDITGQEDICYYVYDCAFNMIAFEPHITVSADNGKAIYTNNTHNPLNGDCMMAVYDGDKMVEFRRFTPSGFVLDAYDTEEFNISAYTDRKYKLFFWENAGNLAPLCAAYE